MRELLLLPLFLFIGTCDGAIPKTLHFIYKSTKQTDWSESVQRNVQSWKTLNPELSVIVWDDTSGLAFVQEEFPHLVELYKSMLLVEKTDLLRYLVLHKHGGIYADTDVECIQSLSELLAEPVSFIAGIEAALENPTDVIRFQTARFQQFTQWTFAAAPQHRVLKCLINRIERYGSELLSVPADRILWLGLDVLDFTGPGVFTDCINVELSQHNKHFVDIGKRLFLDDMLLLGINAFGSFQNHSGAYTPVLWSDLEENPLLDSNELRHNGVFVRHHFAGGWKQGKYTVNVPRTTGSDVDSVVALGVFDQLLVSFWGKALIVIVAFIWLRRVFPARRVRLLTSTQSVCKYGGVACCVYGMYVLVRILGPLTMGSPNSVFIRQSLPEHLQDGVVGKMTVAFKNTGHFYWDHADIKLGLFRGDHMENWQIGQKSDYVLPGEITTFSFRQKFLACNEDPMLIQWRLMYKHRWFKYHFWFGESAPVHALRCVPNKENSKFNAEFINATGVTDNLKLAPYERRVVRITFRNTGTVVWNTSEGVALGLESREDGNGVLNKAAHRVHMAAVSGVVAPGDIAYFVFPIAFQGLSEAREFQWRMVWDKRFEESKRVDAIWFGPTTPVYTITCEAQGTDATFLKLDRSTVPPFLDLSGVGPVTPRVTVAFKNSGRATWYQHKHKLAQMSAFSEVPDAFTALPVKEVHPGSYVVFDVPLSVNIEHCSGEMYKVHWQMMDAYGDRFGDLSYDVSFPCAGIPCISMHDRNVLSGKEFLSKHKQLVQQFGGDALHVPHIVHQSWKSNTCTHRQRSWIGKWRRLHPDWLHVWWSDLELLEMVRTVGPQWYDDYVGFPMDIFRVDFARYVVLYFFGGVYADVDVEPLQDFSSLTEQHKAFVGTEPEAHAVFLYGVHRLICNAVMGSAPGHPFWRKFLDYSVRLGRLEKYTNPVDVTGPQALDKFLLQYVAHNEKETEPFPLEILSDEYFMPHVAPYQSGRIRGWCEKRFTLNNHTLQLCDDMEANNFVGKKIGRNTFSIHHWTCSWC